MPAYGAAPGPGVLAVHKAFSFDGSFLPRKRIEALQESGCCAAGFPQFDGFEWPHQQAGYRVFLSNDDIVAKSLRVLSDQR